MNLNTEINKLVCYIENHSEFNLVKCNNCFYNNHLGAILADIILQSGLNYKSVVLPRVLNIFINYKQANNLNGINAVIQEIGIEKFLNWKNEIKLNRYKAILCYLEEYDIHTSYQFVEHLNEYKNTEKVLSIHGVGNKTIDYFRKLMHIETIAVDRHIVGFLNKADVNYKNYQGAKRIVEHTADILNVSRRDIDYSIWHYMSERNKQLSIMFDDQ